VGIGGVVQPSTKLAWEALPADNVMGYKIYWRDTTSPTWDYSRYVGNVSSFTLDGIVIDNYYFGVSAVDKSGNESVIVFPERLIR
jgi:hypothetical protein